MAQSELLYELDDRPGVIQSLTAAFQHVLASFVGIITPTLIIGTALGMESEIPYLLSMSLFVSGVATFIQARTFGPVGSGLIAVQGTSFAFLGSILAAFDSLGPEVGDLYEHRLLTLNGGVRVHLPNGEQLVGRAVGVESDGRLRVLDECGVTHRLDAADVVHLRPLDPG